MIHIINTLNIKQQQLREGTYHTGSGPDIVLIMGSCRAVPYLNYLNHWNLTNGNKFTLHFIDPFNWNWDAKDNRVDYEKELAKQQSNPKLLKVLKSTSVFVHEYYNNAGMFNVSVGPGNIYSYGLTPTLDITLPNYNDVFVLTREIVSFDTEVRKEAIQDYNVIGKLSEQTLEHIAQVREANLDKFYQVCLKTDFPEFKEIFQEGYKHKRFFLTFNHVAKEFTLTLFRMMNEKFLKLPLTETFWEEISEHDMYGSIFIPLS